ncbi:RidA family protein [Arthrobacter pigmenti]
MKRHINIDNAPTPAGAYSQGVAANGFLFTAGFGPQDPETGTVVEGGAKEQTEQVMRNIQAVLSTQSLSFEDVVKVTVHLQHPQRDFADFNAAYGSFLTQPYPVRTTVGSTLAGILVEIDVVAALS